MALDALWDHSVAAHGTCQAVTYGILAAAVLAALVTVAAGRRRVITMITSFLPAFEDPEVVTAQDIPMLASLRLRRLGRQWARLNLGLEGRRAMARYQLAATELAMACRRQRLGQTNEEGYARHRDDSLTLMCAAAAQIRGQEQLLPPPWTDPAAPSVFTSPPGRY